MSKTTIRRLICDADGCENTADRFCIEMIQFRCNHCWHTSIVGRVQHLGMIYSDVIFLSKDGQTRYIVGLAQEHITVECGTDGIWRAK